MDIVKALKKAVSYHQAGRLDRACDIYTRIHESDPQHPDALHLLGVIAYQTGTYQTAVDLIKRALVLNPGNAAYYKNLGNAYKEVGQLDDAINFYRKAIDLRPEYAEAYFDLGNAYQKNDCVHEAISAYQSALKILPEMAEAHNNLGIALFDAGSAEQAISHYQAAMRLKSDYLEPHINMGNAIKHQGKFRDALNWYRKAIEKKADCAEAYVGMGSVWQNLGRLSTAVGCYQKALEIKPEYAEAHNDLGTVYLELGNFKAAMVSFKKCADLKPRDPEAYINMGNVAQKENLLEKAISFYKRALDLNPDSYEAKYNLGNAYGEYGNSRQAIACFRQTIHLNPDHPFATSLLIRQLQQICAWNELEAPCARLARLTQKAFANSEQTVEMPFLAFSLSDDPGHNFRVAKSWADTISARALEFANSAKTSFEFSAAKKSKDKSRITIGYLSADFKNHATAHLMRGLFGCHDRSDFEIIAYSYGENDLSDYRKQIERDCDKFVDIYALNSLEAGKAINKDNVDILVELKGYTDGSRIDICAHRPAPIQVAWLGFPGTTGADFLDYIITDKIVTPPDHAPYFSEKCVYMPHTYQVNNSRQEIAEVIYRRQDFGLPSEGFIFCSFNETYKIEPVMFDIWMKILGEIPNSILWLMSENGAAQENLKKEAERRGIASGRLIFARKLSKDLHLARLQMADIFLDTRIVNGHTTTSDALWAGIPVITLLGKHFASRVSASLLMAAGIPELIAFSPTEYQKLAVSLAKNADLLKNYKAKLFQNRLKKPLFDTVRFTKNLEKAYKMMWRIYLSGQEPQLIEVSDDEGS